MEVRKKRAPVGAPGAPAGGATPGLAAPGAGAPAARGPSAPSGRAAPTAPPRALTATELAARQRALVEQQRETAKRDAERREQETISILSAAEEARRREEDARKAAEEDARREADEAAKAQAEEAARQVAEAAVAAQAADPTARAAEEPRRKPAAPAPSTTVPTETLRLRPGARAGEEEDDARPIRRPGGVLVPRKPQVAVAKKGTDSGRRAGRIDVQAAIEGEDERVRSLASVRRQRERERRQAELERLRSDQVKVVRDVILPDTITVQELANRMAARAGDVVKALMKLGVMATITQSLDADTAELVVQEFGHRARRVSESDVEIGLTGTTDSDAELVTRAPVVTIMGHVDHGKTSLLDALRSTDVAAGEAGGITQHIGAYQVEMPDGARITFIDTPGHEAFTAMRARGASVTDIVDPGGGGRRRRDAADHRGDPPRQGGRRAAHRRHQQDGQAGRQSRRACARNCCSYEIVVEEMGGETQDVEVSAIKKTGLDKLTEAILLQAEILDLKANPERAAEGTVIESRLDRGRGPVATVLVQKGTPASRRHRRGRRRMGPRARDAGRQGPRDRPTRARHRRWKSSAWPACRRPASRSWWWKTKAAPAKSPSSAPRRQRDKAAGATAGARGTLDEMLARIQAGEQKEVAVLIKADVQGSAEAIQATVLKLAHDEVKVRVLHAAVGQITESDIQLAKASSAVILAFNVRATAQARDLAHREGVDIRYYSIIYEVADDIEKLVKGKVAPKERERFLGYAEVRKVFSITRSARSPAAWSPMAWSSAAAGVRVLRDNVVIHNGELSQLKRFKDDVREVARGYECGLSFANFHDCRKAT